MGGYGHYKDCGPATAVAFYDDRKACLESHLVKSCDASLFEACAIRFEEARKADRECDGSATKSADCQALIACVDAK